MSPDAVGGVGLAVGAMTFSGAYFPAELQGWFQATAAVNPIGSRSDSMHRRSSVTRVNVWSDVLILLPISAVALRTLGVAPRAPRHSGSY